MRLVTFLLALMCVSLGRADEIRNIERKLGYKLKRHPIAATRMGTDGHFYMFIDEKMTWEEAQAWCKARGGYLVTITSQEENDFVMNEIIPKGDDKRTYLGGRIQGNSWSWITGEPTTFDAWYPGRTVFNDRTPRPYMVTIPKFYSTRGERGSPKGKWLMWTGLDAYYFVCEWSF